MKTVAANHAMAFGGPDWLDDGPSHDVVMGKIGEDLRDHYRDITESAQPHALLALARALDTRLSDDGVEL